MVPLPESGLLNTLLNIPALISTPDHLRLFSLPVPIDASGAQKRPLKLDPCITVHVCNWHGNKRNISSD
jgi:hypothetical protein